MNNQKVSIVSLIDFELVQNLSCCQCVLLGIALQKSYW